MPLTDAQCQKLRDAILNVYPYENKAALESLLIKEFNVKLEFTVSYSDLISENDLKKTIQKDNKKRNRKIKILFFQTEPKNLNLNKEFSEIESAIKRASNRSLFNEVIFKPVYSTDDIRQAIANENPQIVHFCGHALEDGSLKLENDSNESLVSPEILKSIFKGREDIIKCVLLNACHSAEATVAISHHIDYAIGMNNQIIDGVAIEFAKGFYDGLGVKNNNKDIFLMAFNEGIRAIIAKNDSQKLIPVFKKRISYEDAILNLIKNINTENKIVNLKSLTNLSIDKLFTKFYEEIKQEWDNADTELRNSQAELTFHTVMKLTKDLRKELREALIHAFPNRDALRMMLRDQLDERLDNIVGGDNLTVIVDKLIEWAESQGRLEELVLGAVKQNPGNAKLQKAAENLGIT